MLFTGTSGNDHLVGSADAIDQFDVFQGGNDRVEGKAGIDLFRFGTSYTSADRVDGGADNDTIELSGAYAGLITLAHMVAVEGVSFLAGTFQVRSLDSIVAAGGLMTIGAASLGVAQPFIFDGSRETDGRFSFNLGAGDDIVAGGDGNDAFGLTLGGDDICVGGLGNDSFFFQAQMTAADRVDGGSGSDILQLNGDYSVGLVFGKHSAESIETLQLVAGHSYDVTTHNTTVSPGDRLVVTAPLGATFSLTFDGSAEKDGNFTISAGLGVDRLTGGDGNDTFTGGNGGDILAGRSGDDTFNYTGADNSNGVAHDTIKGFVAADDLINTPVAIGGVDATVAHGKLTSSHFDAQLARAVRGHDLDNFHAVIFTPDSGSLAGHTFLIVDLNNSAGYQAGLDLVIELVNADLTGLDTANFI